jgi:hypothetical protein
MPAPHVHAACDDASFVGGPFFVDGARRRRDDPAPGPALVEPTPRSARARTPVRRGAGEAARGGPAPCTPAHGAPGRRPDQATLRAVEALVRDAAPALPAFTLALRLEHARHRPAVRVPSAWRLQQRQLIVGPDGLRAALDWEICHLRSDGGSAGCASAWALPQRPLEVGGFGTRDDLRAGYQAAGCSWDEARFQWWKALGTLRWGLGLAGQAKQHLDGSVPSIVLAASGRRVAELEYDTLMLLKKAFT